MGERVELPKKEHTHTHTHTHTPLAINDDDVNETRPCLRSLPHLPDSTLTNAPPFVLNTGHEYHPATMKFCLLLFVACASSALGKCGGRSLDTLVAVKEELHMASA